MTFLVIRDSETNRFIRWVRRNSSVTPAAPCDKLFVPPNMAVAINIAVHNVGFISFAIIITYANPESSDDIMRPRRSC